MREILFRGMRFVDGAWVQGFLVKKSDPVYEDIELYFILRQERDQNGMLSSFATWHEVIAPSVEQYTGLIDKNGKKIFEGDIVKTHYANAPKADFVEQVVFHNGRFCSMYERDKMKMWAPLADGIKHIPQDKSVYMEWCEVIGNIHDNPELLNGGTDNADS